MAHIAKAIEKKIANSKAGVWRTLNIPTLNDQQKLELISSFESIAPLSITTESGLPKLERGLFWVQDPHQEALNLSCLVVDSSIELCHKKFAHLEQELKRATSNL